MVQNLPYTEPKTAECKHIFLWLSKASDLVRKQGIQHARLQPPMGADAPCSFPLIVLPSFFSSKCKDRK